jgi:hypothetical protein
LHLKQNSLSHTLAKHFSDTVDPSNLTIQVKARSAGGWVAFGVSPRGGMLGADMCVLTVDSQHGNTSFSLSDQFAATKEAAPRRDTDRGGTDDWQLLHVRAEGDTITFSARRALQTKDVFNDVDILFSGRNNFVWALGPALSTTPAFATPFKRHVRSGHFEFDFAVSAQRPSSPLDMAAAASASASSTTPATTPPTMSTPSLGLRQLSTAQAHVFATEAREDAAHVSGGETVYKYMQLPLPAWPRRGNGRDGEADIAAPAFHAFRFEPLVDAANARSGPGGGHIVHRMTVYECTGSGTTDDTPAASSSTLSSSTLTSSLPSDCASPLWVWTPGASAFQLPSDVGVPLSGGDTRSVRRAFVELHYEIDASASFVDSSGVRVWYTDRLRPHDAGVIELGVPTAELSLPVGKKAFSLTAVCRVHGDTDADAATVALAGVTFFASHLHMHARGRRMWTAVRQKTMPSDAAAAVKSTASGGSGGGDIAAIVGVTDYFDPLFQPTTLEQHRHKLNAGDVISTRCVYDTTGFHPFTAAATTAAASSAAGDANESAVKGGSTDARILGGTSRHAEMCVNLAMYYPRISTKPRVGKTSSCFDSTFPLDSFNSAAPQYVGMNTVDRSPPPAATIVRSGVSAEDVAAALGRGWKKTGNDGGGGNDDDASSAAAQKGGDHSLLFSAARLIAICMLWYRLVILRRQLQARRDSAQTVRTAAEEEVQEA